MPWSVWRIWAWPGQDAQRNHHCPQQAIGQAFGPGAHG